MIVKVTNPQLRSLMGEIYKPVTSFYFTGSWVEKFAEGKVVLSVKRGKRRRLLKGRIMCVGYSSCRLSSGHLILQFTPNNLTKAQVLLGDRT